MKITPPLMYDWNQGYGNNNNKIKNMKTALEFIEH